MLFELYPNLNSVAVPELGGGFEKRKPATALLPADALGCAIVPNNAVLLGMELLAGAAEDPVEASDTAASVSGGGRGA